MRLLQEAIEMLPMLQPRQVSGSVVTIRGLTIQVEHLPLSVGSTVTVETRGGIDQHTMRRGEVIGFHGDQHIIMLYDTLEGIQPGARVHGSQTSGRFAPLGRGLLGRVVDGLGRPIDGRGPIAVETRRPLIGDGVEPLARAPLNQPLPTGIRVIDAMMTIGRGQRMGIFSRPGVGKSTLLAAMARHASSDVNVIALIGERGREVQEFIHGTLGPEGLARSVVVVSTSDESPLLRVRASLLATAIAEYFRDQDGGQDVLLAMDSLTRFAQAQRQVGLASGEQPAMRGYPPSVFAMLPILVERAGAVSQGGSITGLYTVLVESDDMTEPVSDASQSVLDGHIVLCPDRAARGQYPAVDCLQSISRVAERISDENHRAARLEIRSLLAALRDVEELVAIGAYAKGSDPVTDTALELRDRLETFLVQEAHVSTGYPETCRELVDLATDAIRLRKRLAAVAPKTVNASTHGATT
ncbi:MAG: FliI/YscN family ATPase [Planctomycetota bacterium]|nr:FliI/YscN family ATPase [Planctomycetota bacterium]